MDLTSTDEEKKPAMMVSWVCPCGFVEWVPMNNGYPKFYDISWVKGVILNHGPWGYLVFRQPRWRLSMTNCGSFRPDLLVFPWVFFVVDWSCGKVNAIKHLIHKKKWGSHDPAGRIMTKWLVTS